MVLECTLSKVAGDTKFGAPVNMLEGKAATQCDLDSLEEKGGQLSHQVKKKQKKSQI